MQCNTFPDPCLRLSYCGPVDFSDVRPQAEPPVTAPAAGLGSAGLGSAGLGSAGLGSAGITSRL